LAKREGDEKAASSAVVAVEARSAQEGQKKKEVFSVLTIEETGIGQRGKGDFHWKGYPDNYAPVGGTEEVPPTRSKTQEETRRVRGRSAGHGVSPEVKRQKRKRKGTQRGRVTVEKKENLEC